MDEKTVFQPRQIGSVKPGTRLDGIYEIEKVIAQGGMGEVYRGFNIHTNDVVAIKMIRPEFSDNEDALELFRREAKILLNLVHEAIVRYFLLSVDPGIQRAYLVMEFVDGPSLSQRLTSGPLSFSELTILRKRLASALETAHRLGVVHRDISSDNIILPDSDVRNAKIIDFGIARVAQMNQRTIIGSGFAGKYNYVSPEQLGLAGGDVTFKSDIYSLGLVLAEAARGRPIDMSGSQVQVIEKRRIVPDLSDIDPRLRPLLQEMLQPLPQDRPVSMAAVAEWTTPVPSAAARGRTVEAATERPAHETMSGRWAAIVGAAIAIASLGSVAFFFKDDLARWGRGAPNPAVAPAATPSRTEPASQPPRETETPASPTAGLPPLSAPRESSPPPAPPPPPALAAVEQPAGAGRDDAPLAGKTTPPAAPQVQPPEPAPPHVPTSDELVEGMRPRAALGEVELPSATVGTPYRAELPGFTGKDLRLSAESAPGGLAFHDLGNGKSVIDGTPTQAGGSSMRVVAVNRAGSASVIARLGVQEAPPAPSERAAAPSAPTSGGGESGARPQAPQPSPSISKVEPTPPADDRAGAFVRSFDGGDCFLVKAMPAAGGEYAYLGMGDQLEPFQRFEESFQRDVGVEPKLSLRLIAPPECDAINILRLVDAGDARAPRIALNEYRVGRNRPLSGRVDALDGRRLYLLLVDNEGKAYVIEARPQAGGDTATFSVPLVPDAGSVGPIQIVLAVTSAAPIPILESFRVGEVKTIARAIEQEAKAGAAAIGADFFVFTN